MPVDSAARLGATIWVAAATVAAVVGACGAWASCAGTPECSGPGLSACAPASAIPKATNPTNAPPSTKLLPDFMNFLPFFRRRLR